MDRRDSLKTSAFFPGNFLMPSLVAGFFQSYANMNNEKKAWKPEFFSAYPTIKIIVLCLSFLPAIPLQAQQPGACADLQHGIFHYYPKKSSVHMYCFRDGDREYENEDSNTDTTVWQIQWTGGCTYTEKYLSGSHEMTSKQAAFFQKHVIAFKITSITDDYYIAKAHIDRPSGVYIETDTMWFHEKIYPCDNELFRHVSPESLLRSPISDSSDYAILYVYRPGKLTISLSNYPVYFNEKLLCILANRSVRIFKVFKEGKYTVESRLLKEHSSVNLDVQFGKTYYIKSTVPWTISKRLYNFVLKMAIMDPKVGKEEIAAEKP